VNWGHEPAAPKRAEFLSHTAHGGTIVRYNRIILQVGNNSVYRGAGRGGCVRHAAATYPCLMTEPIRTLSQLGCGL
jgi:hypothetical protein